MDSNTTTKRKGIILVNLGTPESLSGWSVWKYLKEFLMDKHVIDKPYLYRYFLVNWIIVPFRFTKSKAAYKKIWTKEGSPLLVESKKLTDAVAKNVDASVKLAMRYGKPSIESAVAELEKEGVNNIYFIPLYPQYTLSTFESAKVSIENVMDNHEGMRYQIINPFYNEAGYINALAETIKPHLAENNSKYLLFSFHGVPVSHIYKADPTHYQCRVDKFCCCGESKTSHRTCYRHQCYQTASLVAKALDLSTDRWSVAFQSRLGKEEWLQPYTSTVLHELPSKEIKDICVVAPSFTADCIETLGELGIEGKEIFLSSGGDNYITAECLNSSEKWVDFLSNKINTWLKRSY